MSIVLVGDLPFFFFMCAPTLNPVQLGQHTTTVAIPKPRSMQARFILMEAATVFSALFLMVGALTLSVLIHSQFSADIEELHEQIALESRIHSNFDTTVLAFWRYHSSNDAKVLAEYCASESELRTSTRQAFDTAANRTDKQEAQTLIDLENAFLNLTDDGVAKIQNHTADLATEAAIQKIELDVRKTFAEIGDREFGHLQRATARLGAYTSALRIVVVILGLFPVVVMLWFRRAHQLHIWSPLEQLHGMVREVRGGNLEVHAAVPDSVELGSVTTAFLAMASELREMRDSLEEKVRQRAAQLEAAQKDLLRAAKLASLGQLVSGVAHEINNPLTSILGFSEVILSKAKIESAARSQIQTIRDEALRLKHVVANLSQFARRTPRQTHRIDLRTIPDRLLELRSYQLAANNIHLEYRRAPRPIWIQGDRDALLQLLLQLVLNAEQAICDRRKAGEIRLSCESASGSGVLSVEDNGCGMPPEMREHIFDPFFTARPAQQGTGLGLSVCHAIVQQHGGEVTVESEMGRGTTFRVRLPLLPKESEAGRKSADTNEAEAVRAEEKRHSSLESRRFLVIDDEPDILELITEVISDSGAKVVTLQDSTRLEAALDETAFDAALCDLKMPGRDGLSVLRALREKYPDLARHFLLMTGNLADADKAAIELEGVPILPKPFTLVRLREMLAQITADLA
jgi:signal transduction histidine kinase/ActR/RegA family two-component response regulator